MKDKLLVALTIITLLLSTYLIYDTTTSSLSTTEVKTELNNLRSDYRTLQKDLEVSLGHIAVNNKMIAEQREQLEIILRKNEISEIELGEAKKIMQSISQSVLDEYNNRVKYLQDEKRLLTEKSLAISKGVLVMNKKIVNLENDRNKLAQLFQKEKKESDKKTELLKYASNLSLSNFNLQGVKVRNSGKEVETDRASRIDKIKVSFDINDNPLAGNGKKEFYLTIYKPDGSVATFDNVTSGSFNNNGKLQAFSDKVTLNYEYGTTNHVNFEWESDDFKRGDYVIEVYEKNKKQFAKIGGAIKKLD